MSSHSQHVVIKNLYRYKDVVVCMYWVYFTVAWNFLRSRLCSPKSTNVEGHQIPFPPFFKKKKEYNFNSLKQIRHYLAFPSFVISS